MKVILLDHSKVEPGELQMMQFGGFDARVKRIKGVLEQGKYWWEDMDSMPKAEVPPAWAAHAADIGERSLQIGDLLIDDNGKVWMLDHTGWEQVKTLAKPLSGEIDMMLKGVDSPKPADISKEEDRDHRDQKKEENTMPQLHKNGVDPEVVMLPPADIEEDKPEVKADAPEVTLPKRRGRPPGSKNKPKDNTAGAKKAAPKAAKASPKKAAKKMAAAPVKKPAKKAEKKVAKKAAVKAAAKTEGGTKRRRGVVGVKAQTQVPSDMFARIAKRAKEEGVTPAAVIRAVLEAEFGTANA